MDIRYSPFPMAANATRPLVGNNPSVDVRGFLCTTAGNLKIGAGADGSGADIVATIPVTVGQYVQISGTFAVPCALVLSGGAAGTLFASN